MKLRYSQNFIEYLENFVFLSNLFGKKPNFLIQKFYRVKKEFSCETLEAAKQALTRRVLPQAKKHPPKNAGASYYG